MKILGIETSCDETAISLLEARGTNTDSMYDVLGEALLSQIAIHQQYGGVFPNVAKREHARNLVPILQEVLRQADMLVDNHGSIPEANIRALEETLAREPDLYMLLSEFLREHGKPPIDAIAVTVGPGLEPALWVGINFAKALSAIWQVPIIPVNHMEGHILIALEEKQGPKTNLTSYKLQAATFPALALLVSGGHTELVLMREFMKYELLGQTRDDAAGEAFDKCARLLGLPYPGGPEISNLAATARSTKPSIYAGPRFPRPMIDSPDYDFSFSGLKTAVRREVEGKTLNDMQKAEYACEIEDAIIEVLVSKTKRAAQEYNAQTVIVGGGVSASSRLRHELTQALNPIVPLFPEPKLATDNARMIALTGYLHALKNETADPESLRADGNLKLV